MNTMTKSLVLAALSVASLTLVAQNAPEGAPEHPRRPAPPIVTALDVNKDGVIDASEIANAPAAIATLDANADGQVTSDEARPKRPEGVSDRGPGGPREGGPGGGPAGGPPRGGGSPLVAALDANQDQTLDAAEIANSPAALATLDKNSDGQLTSDELRPGRPDGAPEGGKGHGGKRGPRGQNPPANGQ